MTIARRLADFVYGTETVPTQARRIATSAVLDLLTAAIAGFETAGARAARQAAASTWGGGRAQTWFSTLRMTAPGAAFANSAAASTLDLDDGHRAAAGHPGACIIPAVLATAESYEVDAQRIPTAIALGYEIAVRIAAARDLDSVETLVSGPWCGQGAAAAGAWLRGLPAQRIAEAIAIAGACAPNLAAVAYSRMMGNHVKEGIPWATATGMAAVDLAAAGFTGPQDLLDNPRVYDVGTLTGGLGDSWHIDHIYFKPYSCCRWAHAAIDAVLEIMEVHGIAAAEILGIEIHTFARALQLNNDVEPRTLEAAQYSVPFCVALAATLGPGALLPLAECALQEPAVLALARRVTLRLDPDLDAMFSRAVPARVEIATAGGRFTRSIIAPRGEPSNPMTIDDLTEKFETATHGLVAPDFGSSLAGAIRALESGDLGPLRTALAIPLHFVGTRHVETTTSCRV